MPMVIYGMQSGAAAWCAIHREGAEDVVLNARVSQPTCMAFGGDDMNLLFVTSARIGLSDEALAAQPEAGNLFIDRTDVKGVNESWYKASAAR